MTLWLQNQQGKTSKNAVQNCRKFIPASSTHSGHLFDKWCHDPGYQSSPTLDYGHVHMKNALLELITNIYLKLYIRLKGKKQS